MFHRHFDDYIRHGHGPGGFGRGPFRGWRSRGGGFGGREGRMFDGGELRLVDPGARGREAPLRLRGHQGARRAGRGRLFAEPRRRLSDADHARGDGLRQREPGPAGAQALYADGRGREGPRRQQGRRSTPSSPASAKATRRRFAGFISVKRAMLNLRATLRLRLRGRAATPEQIQAIVDALDAAAKAIERV